MTIRPILIHPDPRLKKICEPITDFSDELKHIAEDMLATMYEAPGIGLAGPQIGLLKRLIVLDCVKDRDQPPRPLAMINPEVVWSSEATSIYEEGCLSIPEQYAEVTRPSEVRVRWQDVAGRTEEEHFTGLWATCVQHEIDHLNGKLFIDYLTPLRRQLITRKMEKLKRERARDIGPSEQKDWM